MALKCMDPAESAPSRLWPPDCCETCQGWQPEERWVGRCRRGVNLGHRTDARFKCQDFVRKPEHG